MFEVNPEDCLHRFYVAEIHHTEPPRGEMVCAECGTPLSDFKVTVTKRRAQWGEWFEYSITRV